MTTTKGGAAMPDFNPILGTRVCLGQYVRHNFDRGTFRVIGIDLENDVLKVVPMKQLDEIGPTHDYDDYIVHAPREYSIASCRPAR